MKDFPRTLLLLIVLLAGLAAAAPAPPVAGQPQSVKPDINKPYDDASVQQKVDQFEDPKRDVVRKLDEIVAACELKPGMMVADIGAGTGLFTRPFARKVQPGGKVYAVDITKKFVRYIEATCREQDIKNVVGVVSKATSAELPPASVDLAFTCDTYHHFEYPYKMLDSIHKALRGRGRLVIIDYKREKGVSPEWVFGHVRADKKTMIEEVTKAGFKYIDEVDLMKQQYVVRFEKVE